MRIRVSLLSSIVAGTLFGGLTTGVSVYLWLKQKQLVQRPDLHVAITETTQDSDSVSPKIAREPFAIDLNTSLRVNMQTSLLNDREIKNLAEMVAEEDDFIATSE